MAGLNERAPELFQKSFNPDIDLAHSKTWVLFLSFMSFYVLGSGQ